VAIAQTLLGIYFFLAGWAVGQRRALLLMPVVSALCAALLWLASALSAGLSPRFRCLSLSFSASPAILFPVRSQQRCAHRQSYCCSLSFPSLLST